MTENPARDAVSDIRRPDTERIKELLRNGRLEECGRVLDEVLTESNFFAIRSFMLRLYICMDIFVAAKDFSAELGISEDMFAQRFGTVREIEQKMIGAAKMAECLQETLEQCIVWRAESAADRSAGRALGLVASAKEYIDKSYMDHDISLKTVADAVGLSPAYLSSLFKKDTGKNISEYLTDVRVRRSKELLCCTSKMVYEVAYEVGFHDYKYFSQIFKKHTGLSPRQFQNQMNGIQIR